SEASFEPRGSDSVYDAARPPRNAGNGETTYEGGSTPRLFRRRQNARRRFHQPIAFAQEPCRIFKNTHAKDRNRRAWRPTVRRLHSLCATGRAGNLGVLPGAAREIRVAWIRKDVADTNSERSLSRQSLFQRNEYSALARAATRFPGRITW